MIKSFKSFIQSYRIKLRHLIYDSKKFKVGKLVIRGIRSSFYLDDYKEGEEIHHLDGQTIEEAEHQLATRLYQNNARVHFNNHIEKEEDLVRE